ncbi:MAG TPA: response regulator [Thermoanaerobaculia bacterium]|nr:response regulator [Thermoanaerobaculia bacterium]
MTRTADRLLRLLIIYDEIPLAWRVRVLLEESAAAAIVGEAFSAASALTLLRKRHPDAALVDLEFGDGTEAFTLIYEMKRLRPSLAIVVLSCIALPAFEKSCIALGADVVLDKFRDMERLPEVLNRLPRRARLIGESR